MGSDKKEFVSKSSEFIKKYFFLFATILLMILSFLIIRGFVVALISAFVLAYLAKPLQRKLSRKMPRKLSALVCLIIIILAVLIPLFFLIYGLIQQINENIYLASTIQTNFTLLDSYFPNLRENVLSILLAFLKSTIYQIPSIALSVLVMIMGTYYIIADWENLTKKLELVVPFKDKKRIRKDVSALTDNIVYGYIFIAIIEFIVGAIGFYFSGVGLYLILPALMGILAFIPGLGPGAIWIPTAIYYFIAGDIGTAIGVLITGLVISIFIETILLPRIIGQKSNIHPFIFLLGVIGGVPIFGIFGFIIGPLILVYTVKLVEESLRK